MATKSAEFAIDRRRKELEQQPSPRAVGALALALLDGDRAEEALQVAREAVEREPKVAASWAMLGRVHAAIGNYRSAVEAFEHSASARRGSFPVPEQLELPAHFLRHNVEQLQHLLRSGIAADALSGFSMVQLETLHRKLTQMMPAEPGGPAPFVAVGGAALSVVELPAITVPMAEPAHCLSGVNDYAALESAWSDGPRFHVLDDFLTSEAFKALQNFCLCSTSYRRPYRFGYTGAFPEDGFACELLFRIADELKKSLPRLFAGHRLAQWWAFTYDRHLAGTDIHADDSELSLNLWLTNDEANLDPGGGGLMIWNKSAPGDWSFTDYNSGGSKVSDYLIEQGAQPTVISYRANRAVLFEGRLFHRTEGTRFADGFENRRRNVTLLFRRGAS